MIGKKEKMSAKEIWNLIKALPEEEIKKLKEKFESDFADENLKNQEEDKVNQTKEDVPNDEIDVMQNEEPQTNISQAADSETNDSREDESVLMEMVTKIEARLAALEKSLQYVIQEELGTDSDFVDEVNSQMPLSYARQAKEIRF